MLGPRSGSPRSIVSLSVVHALAPARFGGLESVVHTLATGQAALGQEVTVVGVFTEDPKGHPFWSALQSVSGVRVVPLVLRRGQYFAERRRTAEILREFGANVLHTHGYRPDILLGTVGRSLGVTTVTTMHGFTHGGWKNRFYERLQVRAVRRFDAVVAVSEELGQDLRRAQVPVGAIHVLPNAWAPSEEPFPRAQARSALGLPENGPVVGWVGRLSAEKGPEVALDALAALGAGGSRLSFIGDGPMQAELARRAEAEGMTARICWHGVVPGAARFLRAFDALAITSWTEGTPIVLLEAMAAGVPIVTTAVGGIPDVVSDAEAVLVEPGDAQGIAAGLGPILASDPSVRQRVEAARIRLDREFAVDPWVRRYIDIYRTCLPG